MRLCEKDFKQYLSVMYTKRRRLPHGILNLTPLSVVACEEELFFTTVKWGTSPSWGPPPQCQQDLIPHCPFLCTCCTCSFPTRCSFTVKGDLILDWADIFIEVLWKQVPKWLINPIIYTDLAKPKSGAPVFLVCSKNLWKYLSPWSKENP